MKTIHISLPNSPDNFLLVEMCERLKAGHTVTMLFGGSSMLPLISGTGDKIKLRPLDADEKCKVGKVYLFFHGGHYVIHRLLHVCHGDHDFRGDNCYKHEHVTRENVLAQLTTIIRPDGTEVDCEGEWWKKRSRQVAWRRTVRNVVARVANRNARRIWSVAYFILLAVLMWAPLNGLGIPLDNYVFGFRLFDMVSYKGIPCFVFARRLRGSFDVRTLEGKKISAGVSYKRLKPLTKSTTMLTERSMRDSSQP